MANILPHCFVARYGPYLATLCCGKIWPISCHTVLWQDMAHILPHCFLPISFHTVLWQDMAHILPHCFVARYDPYLATMFCGKIWPISCHTLLWQDMTHI